MYNEQLYHHGVLGQKWGVRKYQNSDGSLTPAGKAREKRRQSAEQKRSDVKNAGTLTDAQLKKKIERLQMEKQLRELTNSEVNSGRTYVAGIMKDVGRKVVTTAAAGAILYAGKAALTKSFDAKELGNAIFNGGAKKK